jgi:tetratricopeptide (TPR) repeat protein
LKGKELTDEWKYSMAEEELLRAHTTLETALEANPGDIFLCMLNAEVCSEICDVIHIQSDDGLAGKELEKQASGKGSILMLAERYKVARTFQERAESYYRHAASLDKNNSVAQRKCGLFLSKKLERYAEAEPYLLRAMELTTEQGVSVDPPTLVELVEILDRRGDVERANSLGRFFRYINDLQDFWLERNERMIAEEISSGHSSLGHSRKNMLGENSAGVRKSTPSIWKRKESSGSVDRSRVPPNSLPSSGPNSLHSSGDLNVRKAALTPPRKVTPPGSPTLPASSPRVAGEGAVPVPQKSPRIVSLFKSQKKLI